MPLNEKNSLAAESHDVHQEEKDNAWLDRTNKEIAAAVNRGIAVARLEGIPAGAKIMFEAGVPMDVSTRVLVNQLKRRSSDWQ
ncbi:hypothetical protein [Sapientia aquatica]|uniref:Uncharacterized protein n=1 Tax=Sapientia aquatica TaxID=1549640 RepID=A0A4R5W6C3_9BURK|nr:hypothetical protein [Sapientia aquatica]TDK68711.1 hypothetical protein E2I14_04030 [Sapientia aquatica]